MAGAPFRPLGQAKEGYANSNADRSQDEVCRGTRGNFSASPAPERGESGGRDGLDGLMKNAHAIQLIRNTT